MKRALMSLAVIQGLTIAAVVVIALGSEKEIVLEPDTWARAPDGCFIPGTNAVSEGCSEWQAKQDPQTGQYRQLVARQMGGCELYRTRYRGIYYLVNTCGGVVVEPGQEKY